MTIYSFMKRIFENVTGNQFRLINENDSALTIPQEIKAQYQSSDGHKELKSFRGPNAIADVRAWIEEWVGLNGDISEDYNYIVSDDGVGRIMVQGIDIATAVGRPPKPKLQDSGYVNTLADISIKLNFPELVKLPNFKISNTWKDLGRNYTIDWKRPVSGKFNDKYGYYKGKKEQVRFTIHISEDEYTSNIDISSCYFASPEGSIDQERYFDKHNQFKPSGDRDRDLQEIEKFLKPLEQWVKEIVEQNKK